MSNDSLNIHIEIGGNAKEALERLAKGIKDPELMNRIGEDVASFAQDRIREKGNTAPDGTKWKPLTLSTLKRKQKKNLGHQGTLMESGSMWSQIRHANVTEDKVDVGSPRPYAMIHQFGGKTGKGHKTTIPARPYIGLSRADEDYMREFLTGWFKRLLAKAVSEG